MTEAAGGVLVVDDQEDARTSLAEILRIEGYRVATAADGLEALDYLRSHPLPEVILLDLMMPRMNGWEFRRRQLADPATAHIPVAVISGADISEQNQSSLQAVGLFVKPLQIERLLETVAAHCRSGP